MLHIVHKEERGGRISNNANFKSGQDEKEEGEEEEEEEKLEKKKEQHSLLAFLYGGIKKRVVSLSGQKEREGEGRELTVIGVCC